MIPCEGNEYKYGCNPGENKAVNEESFFSESQQSPGTQKHHNEVGNIHYSVKERISGFVNLRGCLFATTIIHKVENYHTLTGKEITYFLYSGYQEFMRIAESIVYTATIEFFIALDLILLIEEGIGFFDLIIPASCGIGITARPEGESTLCSKCK